MYLPLLLLLLVLVEMMRVTALTSPTRHRARIVLLLSRVRALTSSGVARNFRQRVRQSVALKSSNGDAHASRTTQSTRQSTGLYQREAQTL